MRRWNKRIFAESVILSIVVFDDKDQKEDSNTASQIKDASVEKALDIKYEADRLTEKAEQVNVQTIAAANGLATDAKTQEIKNSMKKDNTPTQADSTSTEVKQKIKEKIWTFYLGLSSA